MKRRNKIKKNQALRLLALLHLISKLLHQYKANQEANI